MIFEGLKDHEAVKVGDSYIVKLGGSRFEDSYVVNGHITTGNKQVVVKDLSDVEGYEKEKTITTGVLLESGEIISIDEYNAIFDKYEKYIDCDGNMDFGSDYETELQYVKDKAAYQVKEFIYSKLPPQIYQVSIKVVGHAEDTGSKFIETPFVYGKVKHRHGSGIYKVKLSEIAMDEFLKIKNEFQDVKFEVPNHSHLEYAKVGGKYVFNSNRNEWIVNSNFCRVLDDLEEAKSLEKQVRSDVRSSVLIYATPRKASDVEIKDFVQDLEIVLENVRGLDVKVKSSQGHKSTIRKLLNLISKYKEMN